jgi:hypothetical protein
MHRLSMMIACSALLVDVTSIEPHTLAPSVMIAMPRVSRHRRVMPHVVPRRMGTRRLATVAAPIAS